MDDFLQYLLAFSVVMLGVVFVLRAWVNGGRRSESSPRFSRRSRSRRSRRGDRRSSRRGMQNNRSPWKPYEEPPSGNQEPGNPSDDSPRQ